MSSAAISNMEVHVYAPNLATVTGDYTEKGKNKSGKSFSRTYSWVGRSSVWRYNRVRGVEAAGPAGQKQGRF